MNSNFTSITDLIIAGKTFNRLFVSTPQITTPPNAPAQIRLRAVVFSASDVPANQPQGQPLNVATLPDTITRTIQLNREDVTDLSFVAIANKVIEVLGVTVA